MSEIAQAAGVSRQTLYKEFGSRDEFAQALVIQEGERFLDAVDAAVREHLDDPRAAIGAALETFLRTAGEDPLVRILLSDDGTGGMLPFVTTQGMPVVQWATARLTATIEQGWPRPRPPRPACSPRPSSASRSATSPPPASPPRPPPPTPASCSAPSSTRRSVANSAFLWSDGCGAVELSPAIRSKPRLRVEGGDVFGASGWVARWFRKPVGGAPMLELTIRRKRRSAASSALTGCRTTPRSGSPRSRAADARRLQAAAVEVWIAIRQEPLRRLPPSCRSR